MSSKELAYITPALISWAIDRSGLTYSQIEKSLNSSEREIDSWITGEQFPTLNKAIKLAKILRVPFGYFFMEKPPKLEVPLPDFRILKTSQTRMPSLDFLDTLYSSITQQKWYRQYLLEQGTEPLSFVGKFTVNDDENTVANDIRSTILIYDARYRSTKWKDYFAALSKNAESAGILVMRNGVVGNDNTRSLLINEFQGFAITDLIAPLVFINNNDTDAPKIFTLIHELAHIWVGKSAISNPEEGLIDDAIPIIEIFCNKVATEVLVPREEFLSIWKPYGSFEQIEKLARHFFC